MSRGQAENYNFVRLRETLVVAESTRRTMQANRSIDSGPEIALRRALWKAGLRGYRKNVSTLPGKPDIVFCKAQLAVFVHGCYWHGCPKCMTGRIPKTNPAYWAAKLEANRSRDDRSNVALKQLGYRVLTFWECELKNGLEAAVSEIQAALA